MTWDLSSAGRASALQAEGHRFKSCRSHLFFVNIKYGGIAQLARARGSYPRCRWFKSSSRYFLLQFFVCNGRQAKTRKGYYVKKCFVSLHLNCSIAFKFDLRRIFHIVTFSRFPSFINLKEKLFSPSPMWYTDRKQNRNPYLRSLEARHCENWKWL